MMDRIEDGRTRVVRIAALGERGVGKTRVLSGLWQQDWASKSPAKPKPTKGVELYERLYREEGDSILVEYVEFGGDFDEAETYAPFLEIFCEERRDEKFSAFDAVFFFFDVRNKASLEESRKWLAWLSREFRRLLNPKENSRDWLLREQKEGSELAKLLEIPVIFIGTKLDHLAADATATVGDFLSGHAPPAPRKTLSYVFDFLSRGFDTPDANNVLFAGGEDLSHLLIMEQMIMRRSTGLRAADSLPIDLSRYKLRKFVEAPVINFRSRRSFLKDLFHALTLGYFD